MSRGPQQTRRTGTPCEIVGDDDRRACAGKPTWQWFALPFIRRTEDEDGPYPGGDDAKTRRAGHEAALRTCVSCPLVLRCVQASWTTEEFGTYGAISEKERFMLGGRGNATSIARTFERYEKALNRVAKRFGSPEHPVVRWIAAQGLPRGVVAPEPAVEQPQEEAVA